ncbi:MAG: flippase [Bacilli bacterium]|nr:flippase [Bacilli bacterium]
MASLAKNSFYNILYRCISVIFPLISVSYVSHILQAEGVGSVASATNVANYFVILAALGLPTYGTKVIGSSRNPEETNNSFWELYLINLLSTIFFSIAYYSLIFTFPFFSKHLSLYCVVGLAIVFNFINVDWFYQGKEEFGFITLRSFIVKILALLAILLFVKTKEDILTYALILTLSNVANYIFNIIHLRKFVTFSKQNLKLRKHVKPILLLLLASIIIELYTMYGTTMLTFYSSSESVGYYSNSVSIIRIIRSMVTAVCAVFLPRLSYYYSSNKHQEFKRLIEKGLGILIYLTIPAAIGIFLVSYDAVFVLFGNSFIKASSSVKILSFTIVTIALSNFIGYQIFITVGKEKIMVISTVIGAIINILLNFILIRKFDFIGVAFATTLSELSVTIYQLLELKKLSLLNCGKKLLSSVFVSSLAMLIVVILLQQIHMLPIVELITCITVGIITYFSVSMSLKNEFAVEILNKILVFLKK